MTMLLSLAAMALPTWQFASTQPDRVPWSISATEEGIEPWRHPEVVKVQCLEGSGTAFRVGPKILLSVAHVITLHGCTINGATFKVLDKQGDFATIEVDKPATNWLHIDCGGFVAGKQYEAIGYARGLDTQTSVDITATGDSLGGFSRLTGVFTVIPGQSGGALLDEETGAVVGTVNVYNAERGDSGSIPLSTTSVCSHA